MDTKRPDDEYVGLSKSEFIPGTSAPADIFLKLSATNYVLLLKEGHVVQFDQMHSPEKTEWLYVRRVDYHKCVGQTLAIAGLVIDSNQITDIKKTVFLSKAADSTFREIEHLGFDHQTLEHSKIISKSIQTLVESKDDLFSVINIMGNLGDGFIKHSMMVSAISVVIAKSMKWTLAQNLEKLALGALLHDIGMKELPEELLTLPRHAMTREQAYQYETHVYRGVEILRSMPSISDDVIAMALEHHENAPGQGYPRRLRDIKTNPFARIVALADCFSELVMKTPNNPHPKTAQAAIQFIEITLGQPFHKPAFIALKQALNESQDSLKKAS